MRAPASHSENWRVKKSCPAFPVQIIVHRNQLGSVGEGQSLPNNCLWTSRKFKKLEGHYLHPIMKID